MARRYLAFDIETAIEVPGEDFNWRPHLPLGIACAATLTSDTSEIRLWHGKKVDGLPARRMSPADALALSPLFSQIYASGTFVSGASSSLFIGAGKKSSQVI
jgi:hypothetical protein